MNKGNGTFEDVSMQWGIWDHVGKGMGVGMADYDLDGRPDLLVTNDTRCFTTQVISSRRLHSRPVSPWPKTASSFPVWASTSATTITTGFPTSSSVALNNQTFPLFQNTGKGDFREVTTPSGLREPKMAPES